jgi:hypothetical protein
MSPRTIPGPLTLAIIAVFTTLSAQQPKPQNESVALAAAIPEIQIDRDCRVLTAGRASAENPNPKPHYRENETVCHIEGEHTTNVWNRVLVNGKPKQILVTVQEREYVLQNTGNMRVAFIVTDTLPKGWSIDSDPQPVAINGKDAIFRVIAQPGQIVRLHVGERS